MKKAIAWQIDPVGIPKRLTPGLIDLEKNLENWVDKDIDIVADDVLIIGRQLATVGYRPRPPGNQRRRGHHRQHHPVHR